MPPPPPPLRYDPLVNAHEVGEDIRVFTKTSQPPLQRRHRTAVARARTPDVEPALHSELLRVIAIVHTHTRPHAIVELAG